LNERDNRSQESIERDGEVRLLRHEIRTLKDSLDILRTDMASEENKDHRRLAALETQVTEFERKFNVGKGIFYGLIAGLGAGGVFVLDHLFELARTLGMMK
jgi:hypothetical protein